LPIAQGAIDPDALTDASVSLSQLQQQLEDAIENEDYGAAAELRDEIE